MNLHNFLKKYFFNRKTKKFIKKYLKSVDSQILPNSELIKRKIEELEKLEETPEKIMALYILNCLQKNERIDYEESKESIRKILIDKNYHFDPIIFHKLFKAISYFLIENYIH